MEKACLISFFCLMTACSRVPLAGQTQAELHVIPKPDSVTVLSGTFRMTQNTSIEAQQDLLEKAEQLRGFLSTASGFRLPINEKGPGGNLIQLKLTEGPSSLGEEGYELSITPQSVLIAALKPRGIFWGMQTLRQLFPNEILREARMDGAEWILPCVKIVDRPRFRWRGLMIDYSRTFWNKHLTKKYIDALSYYKMNTLHMHLTDDQGWRLEITKYPKLTEVASRFDTLYHEPPEREGYYSKNDIRELVQYAAERNVELVPEIEMPGHSLAILAAYPELSCTGEKVSIHPYLKGPGIHSEILCAGRRGTFEFLRNVLSEVIELFPSNYVHIGGDEVPKLKWEACPDCQRTIKEQGLKGEAELQSWFTGQVETYLNSKGKKLVGWDEVTEGGFSKTATVMFWRGMGDDLVKAISQGNDVILTPTSHCYFDYSYETTSTEKVYSFEPLSGKIENSRPEHILGVQANFWSHIARTEPEMDRQVFPRLLALAEVGWTKTQNRHWSEFNSSLKHHYRTLDLLDVYYFTERENQ